MDEGTGPCNLGRVVYHDIRNERFIKIFHPGYCRLKNLKEALESGVLNGLCPALTDLIYDNNQLIGYICEEGHMLAKHKALPGHWRRCCSTIWGVTAQSAVLPGNENVFIAPPRRYFPPRR